MPAGRYPLLGDGGGGAGFAPPEPVSALGSLLVDVDPLGASDEPAAASDGPAADASLDFEVAGREDDPLAASLRESFR